MISRALAGTFRSLRLYHGPEAPRAAMDAFYRPFIDAGDLVFDIGAHVGDRVASFRRLGARVVAVEPQPLLVRALRLIHGNDENVEILAAAAGAGEGETVLNLNTANPTVSTVSTDFVRKARAAQGWENQSWDDEITVDVLTLDELVQTYGVPAFVKIDVEGYEDVVLNGLSAALPLLSFEFTTVARDVAMRALARLSELGEFEYNVALGESYRITFAEWISIEAIAEHLSALPHSANSGDVYARLVAPS
jgi:FkbM family methyltransferase